MPPVTSKSNKDIIIIFYEDSEEFVCINQNILLEEYKNLDLDTLKEKLNKNFPTKSYWQTTLNHKEAITFETPISKIIYLDDLLL